MLSNAPKIYKTYQAVATLDEQESFATEAKTQATITTVLTTMSAGPTSELERLFEIEKYIKTKMKSPLFDNAITALLAMISLLYILFEFKGLLGHFSWGEKISHDDLYDPASPVGAFHEYAAWLTYIAVGYSFRTLKYSIDGLPDEIVGEVSLLANQDVSQYNKTKMLSVIKTLIHDEEKSALEHSEADLYIALNNIRLKLDAKLKWNDKAITTMVRVLRGIGFVSLMAGVTENQGNHDTIDSRALLAYLTAGLTFDLAYFIKLIAYYVPSTERVLDRTELDMVKEALQVDAIHKHPADHTLHALRRHSIRFFAISRTVGDEKEEHRPRHGRKMTM